MKPANRFNEFPAYTPIEPFEVLSKRLGLPVEEIVKLDANENPYGPSPRVREALSKIPFPHIYPDPQSRLLREALSDFTAVPPEYLLAGAGADELIDLLTRVLLETGDAVINCPPTFSMYTFDTLLNSGVVLDIPRRPDFSLDLSALGNAVEEHQPKMIFLTSPNNPDGRLMTQEELTFMLGLPLLIVIDEAYIEFTDGSRLGENMSLIKEVPQRNNLVVLRTFSKWAGLAGLRVGYGAFPQWLLPTLWKVKQPYNVNVAASTAALASLRDLDTLANNIDRMRKDRNQMYENLDDIPYLTPYPSQGNFVLCKVNGRPAGEIKEALMKRGILVRHYNNPLLEGYIRISVGLPEDIARLFAALEEMI